MSVVVWCQTPMGMSWWMGQMEVGVARLGWCICVARVSRGGADVSTVKGWDWKQWYQRWSVDGLGVFGWGQSGEDSGLRRERWWLRSWVISRRPNHLHSKHLLRLYRGHFYFGCRRSNLAFTKLFFFFFFLFFC